jgi:hypothetical protein
VRHPSIAVSTMSLMGQTRHFDGAPLTSGLPQLADILWGSRHVSKVPMNETARAVGRCGVGRGRANNGWSDRASYVTWRRRTKEHPQA